MYLKHYNLTLKPFEISPDPKFLWLGEKHKEALAALKYGILDNKGFISLTGDAGTGKTTLVNALANSLDDNIIFAQITDPALGQVDFINLTADAYKMKKRFSTKGDFLSHLKVFLNDAYVRHKDVVLLIEEAQRIDPERLEELRLISNIEEPDKKLINIIFVGQNEFNSVLQKNEALRQRIAVVHKLEPLQEIETEQYVTHRLKVAGSDQKIFSAEAVHEIYSFSKGNPRLINIICDFALLTGYAKDKTIIEAEIIRESAANCLSPQSPKDAPISDIGTPSNSIPQTQTGHQPGNFENSYQFVAQKTPKKAVGLKRVYLVSVLVVIFLSIFGYLYFFGENHAPYRSLKAYIGQTLNDYIGITSETSAPKPGETAIQQSNIAVAQVQALDLKTQNTSSEYQLAQLKPNNEELRAALEELKGAKERVVELEREVEMIDTMLSQSQLKIVKLSKELKQENHKGEVLSSELSTKVDLIAELQEKLEDSQSDALKAKTKIENSNKKINALQKDLLTLKKEKASTEMQLGQLKADFSGLSADIQELKSTKDRVAELESAAAVREQTLTQKEQQVADLTAALEEEKKGGEQLRNELSAKADRVAELEQKLAAALTRRTELEKDIEKSNSETAALEEQLQELKTQKASSDSRLSELTSRNETLAADLEASKGTKDRVAELESAAAVREQTLARSQQKVAGLTAALEEEKKGGEQLRNELSTKADRVAELEQKLAAALTRQTELEKDLEKSNSETAELQQKLQTSQADQQALQATIDKREKEFAVLQNQLEGPERRPAPTASSTVSEIADLKDQLLDLKAQKTAADARMSELKSSNERLVADLEEFKSLKELVSTLKAELAAKDQVISSSEQRLSHLANELDQEKKSGERLRSEFSSTAALTAELQEKFETSQTKALDRVAELESAAATREQTLTQSEQKIKDLTVALEQEKKGRKQLRIELSAKADRMAELEQKLAAALSRRTELENDVELSKSKVAEYQQQLQTSQANQQLLQATIEKSEKEIVELQNQLKGFEAQQTPAAPSPGVAKMPKKTAPQRDVVKDQGVPPNPSNIIDWVLKKKAK